MSRGYICLKTGAAIDAEPKYGDDGKQIGRWCSGRPSCLHLGDFSTGYEKSRRSWRTRATVQFIRPVLS